MNFRKGESATDVLNRLGSGRIPALPPLPRPKPTPASPSLLQYVEAQWKAGKYYGNLDIEAARATARADQFTS